MMAMLSVEQAGAGRPKPEYRGYRDPQTHHRPSGYPWHGV